MKTSQFLTLIFTCVCFAGAGYSAYPVFNRSAQERPVTELTSVNEQDSTCRQSNTYAVNIRKTPGGLVTANMTNKNQKLNVSSNRRVSKIDSREYTWLEVTAPVKGWILEELTEPCK